MATIAGIKIDLELLTAKFNRQVKQSTGGLRGLQKSAGLLKGSLSTLVPAAGAAGLSVLIKNAIEGQAALFDLSKRLSISTEDLSQLQYAAEQSGVSVQTLNLGLQRQVRRIAEAAQGTGEAVKALDELNLSAEKLNQLAPDEQFRILADAIKEVENPADRVRLAMKLFDSEGVALIQTMTEGSAGLRAFGEEADMLGRTISGEAAQGAKDASDAFTRMGGAVTGLSNDLAISLAPALVNAANFLATKIPAAIQFTQDAFESLAKYINGPAFGDGGNYQEQLEAVNAQLRELEDIQSRGGGRSAAADRQKVEALEAQQKKLEGLISISEVLNDAPAIDEGNVETMDSYATAAEKAAAALQSVSGSTPSLQEQKKITDEAAAFMQDRAELITRVKNEENNKQAENEKTNLEKVASIQAAGSKKVTAITKSAALAQATIEGYKAIQGALAAPPFFPFNLGQVALVTAMQAGNIAAIAGTSFAGGGYTGSGTRAGGIDGMGGFPAILHPNETVVDHSRGQGYGGTGVIINVTANDASGFQDMLETQRGYIHNIVVDALADSGRSF